MDKLIPLSNATQIVAVVNDTYRDVKAALDLLKQAKLRLKNTFGEHRDTIFPHEIRDYSFENGGCETLYNAAKLRIKREAWSFIVDKIQIKSLLSIKRQEELERQLHGNRNDESEDSLPDVSEESIFEFINNTLGKAPDMVEEAIQEVFEILRPHRQYHNFKSNPIFEIGKRVCFEWYMDTSFGMCRTNYYREKEINAIDKLFHLLDGKGSPQYPNVLTTQLNEACRQKKWDLETEYFSLKWYKKGSLHIEFKRPDLVAELNKRAGGMRLK